MKKEILVLWIGVSALSGFLLGMMQRSAATSEVTAEVPFEPEKSTVTFTKIEGDTLFLSLEGNVRAIWGDEHFLDESGPLFLGQIPDANDLQFRSYPFVGNANTGKFYPSTTSWARGVRVSDRRFFSTKEAAIEAGFIPSKSVK
jgi:hypothetical protein